MTLERSVKTDLNFGNPECVCTIQSFKVDRILNFMNWEFGLVLWGRDATADGRTGEGRQEETLEFQWHGCDLWVLSFIHLHQPREFENTWKAKRRGWNDSFLLVFACFASSVSPSPSLLKPYALMTSCWIWVATGSTSCSILPMSLQALSLASSMRAAFSGTEKAWITSLRTTAMDEWDNSLAQCSSR